MHPLLRLTRPLLSPRLQTSHLTALKAPYRTTNAANMRIPYVADPPPTKTDDEAAIVARVQARRAPRPLQPLDLALLHSPPVADGWNSFLGAVRTRTSIPADLRELAISRVAVCNRAWYEWGHHAPLAIETGVDEKLMEAVKVEEPLTMGGRVEGLSERQWAVLVYTDEMTRNVQVRDETFEVMKGLFSEQEIVEITATVSSSFQRSICWAKLDMADCDAVDCVLQLCKPLPGGTGW